MKGKYQGFTSVEYQFFVMKNFSASFHLFPRHKDSYRCDEIHFIFKFFKYFIPREREELEGVLFSLVFLLPPLSKSWVETLTESFMLSSTTRRLFYFLAGKFVSVVRGSSCNRSWYLYNKAWCMLMCPGTRDPFLSRFYRISTGVTLSIEITVITRN